MSAKAHDSLTVFCPQPTCRGHRFTYEELRAERSALRPFSTTPASSPMYTRLAYEPNPHACFRDHDAHRTLLASTEPIL